MEIEYDYEAIVIGSGFGGLNQLLPASQKMARQGHAAGARQALSPGIFPALAA